MRVISVLVCVAATLLLGGCIMSERPLIPAEKAVMPLEAGTYRGGKTEDPDLMRDNVIVVRKSGEYSVTETVLPSKDNQLKEQTVTVYTIRFHQLDEDHYVAQVRVIQKTATSYQYAFVHFAGEVVKFYTVRCDRFAGSGRILRAYNMVIVKPGGTYNWCEAKSLDGLVAFMREVPLRSEFALFTEFYYAIAPKWPHHVR